MKKYRKLICALYLILFLLTITSCSFQSSIDSNISKDDNTTVPTDNINNGSTISPDDKENNKTEVEPTVPNGPTIDEELEEDKYASYRKSKNYGSNVEKAIEITYEVKKGLLPDSSSTGKKEKKSYTTVEKDIMERVEGLSGIPSIYEGDASEVLEKSFTENLQYANSIFYSILFSDKQYDDFNGITFSKTGTFSDTLIRVDTISENAILIITKARAFILGLNDDNQYCVILQTTGALLFQYVTKDSSIIYNGAENNALEELNPLLNYIKSKGEKYDSSTLEIVFEKFKEKNMDELLMEKIDTSLLNEPKDSKYVERITSHFYDEDKRNDVPTVTDGIYTGYSSTETQTIHLIPSGTTSIETFDSYKNYVVFYYSLHLPNTVQSISRNALTQVVASYYFTDYTLEEFPESLREQIFSVHPNMKIFYKDQWVVDENDIFIPISRYIVKAKQNENGIDITQAMSKISNYEEYSALYTSTMRDILHSKEADLYVSISDASDLAEVEEQIQNYNDYLASLTSDFSNLDLVYAAINEIVNANSYVLNGTYQKENSFTFSEKVCLNYVIQDTRSIDKGSWYRFTVFYIENKYQEFVNDFYKEQHTSLDEIKAEYPTYRLLNDAFKGDISKNDFVYDEIAQVYRYSDGKSVNLEITLTNGHVFMVCGSIGDYTNVSLTFTYINTYQMSIDSYLNSLIPRDDDIYKSIYSSIFNLYDNEGSSIYEAMYENAKATLESFSNLTKEEIDRKYRELVLYVLSGVDFETFDVYYTDVDGKKVYVEPNTLPADIYQKLHKQAKNPKEYLSDLLTDYLHNSITSYTVNIDGDSYTIVTNGESYTIYNYKTGERYAFLKNNNGNFVVCHNNQYVETVASLDKYQDIISMFPYYDFPNLILSLENYTVVQNDKKFMIFSSDYEKYIEITEEKYYNIVFTIDDVASFYSYEFTTSTSNVRVSCGAYETTNFSGHLTQTEAFIFQEHMDD